MEQTDTSGDGLETRVTDLVIRLIVLGLFAYLSLGLLRPFVSMFVWAVILTVARFPIYRSLAAAFGGRCGLAAAVVTLATLAVLLGPLAALTASFIETAASLAADVRPGTRQVPAPPASVAGWPVTGGKLHDVWLLASGLNHPLRGHSVSLAESLCRWAKPPWAAYPPRVQMSCGSSLRSF
jgi:hypothetical protein